jgi:hypothetical protein
MARKPIRRAEAEDLVADRGNSGRRGPTTDVGKDVVGTDSTVPGQQLTQSLARLPPDQRRPAALRLCATLSTERKGLPQIWCRPRPGRPSHWVVSAT